MFGLEGTFSVINQYRDENRIQVNKFRSFPLPVMIEKGYGYDGVLYNMLETAFLNVIMGAPIDEYDKAIADWKALGGDEITRQVNDWYKTVKK